MLIAYIVRLPVSRRCSDVVIPRGASVLTGRLDDGQLPEAAMEERNKCTERTDVEWESHSDARCGVESESGSRYGAARHR